MVTQIQLGNIFSQNDKTILTGGSSGLDIESLINSLAEAKRQPAVVLEGRIEANAAKSEALGEMRGLLEDFKDAANFLRSPPGVQNDADNIFQFRTASVASNTSIAGSTYLSVTAEPGVNVAEYEIEIGQLATRNIQTTDTFALADADTSAVGGAGPLNAGTLLVGASSTPVTLVAGDTLNQVVAKVNAVSDQSGVRATAIKVSNGNYRISFTAVETGTSQNYNILALNPGIFNVAFAIQQNAVDASITFDGTTISRETNSIDDLIEGLTFNLLQETPVATTLEVGIESDTELAKQGILNFVDSYNAFRLFTSRQSELGDDGTPADSALLVNNQAMRATLNRVMAEMSHIVDGITAGDPSRLADLGITLSDFPGDDENPFTRNILTVDEEALDSALEADFDAVRRVFEFDYSADDPDLTVFARTNDLAVSDVSLNIDQTNQIFQATYTLDGVLTTVNLTKANIGGGGGISLTGPDGSALEGLVLLYSSSADATVDLNLTQGVSDRVWNALDTLLEEDTGTVEAEISSIADQSERYQVEVDRIDEMIEKFRQQLLDKFSALESAISSANTILQSLNAQQQALANA